MGRMMAKMDISKGPGGGYLGLEEKITYSMVQLPCMKRIGQGISLCTGERDGMMGESRTGNGFCFLSPLFSKLCNKTSYM